MSVKLLLKANANFGNFCFNHDLNKETIIYNCTGNKDKVFIDNNSFHSRNRLSNILDTQSFVVRANSFNCFPSSVHVADRGGKSFLTSRAIYRVYQYSVYICQGSEREDFVPIMSKITHFFAPTSSDVGKRSNANSTSDKNNKDELMALSHIQKPAILWSVKLWTCGKLQRREESSHTTSQAHSHKSTVKLKLPLPLQLYKIWERRQIQHQPLSCRRSEKSMKRHFMFFTLTTWLKES